MIVVAEEEEEELSSEIVVGEGGVVGGRGGRHCRGTDRRAETASQVGVVLFAAGQWLSGGGGPE